jgi:hypothetical protein
MEFSAGGSMKDVRQRIGRPPDEAEIQAAIWWMLAGLTIFTT